MKKKRVVSIIIIIVLGTTLGLGFGILTQPVPGINYTAATECTVLDNPKISNQDKKGAFDYMQTTTQNLDADYVAKGNYSIIEYWTQFEWSNMFMLVSEHCMSYPKATIYNSTVKIYNIFARTISTSSGFTPL